WRRRLDLPARTIAWAAVPAWPTGLCRIKRVTCFAVLAALATAAGTPSGAGLARFGAGPLALAGADWVAGFTGVGVLALRRGVGAVAFFVVTMAFPAVETEDGS
ncbi:MAG: hypothetical protein KAY54_05930, partial [Burkholderiaceae bacterium]|nr:hypothetical protein [Burkholderiaceae bacterium]